jgi:hypothetical protein
MAVVGTYIKGLRMINVAVISNNPANTLDVLSQQNDMSVTKILPTIIENIVEQSGLGLIKGVMPYELSR